MNSAIKHHRLKHYKLFAYPLLFSISALFAILILLPAQWVLPANLPAPWVIDQIEGSLWQGSARMGWRYANNITYSPGRWVWIWQDWRHIQVQHPWLAQPMTLTINWPTGGILSPPSLTWGAGEARFPATWLSNWGAPWNTLRPQGEMSIDWAAGSISKADGWIGKARLTWHNAAFEFHSVAQLGNYECLIHAGAEQSLRLDCRTLLSIALTLNASAVWTSQSLTWEVDMLAQPNYASTLQSLMDMVAPAQPPGSPHRHVQHTVYTHSGNPRPFGEN